MFQKCLFNKTFLLPLILPSTNLLALQADNQKQTQAMGMWKEECFHFKESSNFDYNTIMDVLNYKLDCACDVK